MGKRSVHFQPLRLIVPKSKTKRRAVHIGIMTTMNFGNNFLAGMQLPQVYEASTLTTRLTWQVRVKGVKIVFNKNMSNHLPAGILH